MSDYKQLVESKRQAMLDVLMTSIENNPARWERGWVSLSVMPINGVTHKHYNGVNALFLYAVAEKYGFKDPRWVTFHQAKELGANIKAGAKASEVFFWSRYDKKTKKQFDERTLDGMTEEEKREYLAENVKPVLKFYQVFNAEQCDKFPEYTKQEMSDEERQHQNALIETVIKNSEAPVHYDGGSQAYYSPSSDSIHLPTIESFKSMNSYYATALHEIGHSTGHPSRLNRDFSGDFGSENYAIEELRAELSSVFMQAELDIDLSDAEIANHGAYLKSWLEVVKNDPKTFYSAANDAGKIANYLKDKYLSAEKELVGQVEQVQQVEQVKSAISVEQKGSDYIIKHEKLSWNMTTSELPQDVREAANWLIANGYHTEQDVQSAFYSRMTSDMSDDPQTAAEKDNEAIKTIYKERLENTKKKQNQQVEQFEFVGQVGLVSIAFSTESQLKEYGKSTMFRIPKDSQSEFSSFVFLVPTKFARKTENGVILNVPADFELVLKNDGREVKMTASELCAELEGQKTGKSAQRVSASKRNIARLDALRANVPAEMRNMPNWCVYRTKWNDEKGKKDKYVLSALDGHWAKSNQPETWTDFETAYNYAIENNCEGLSFALNNDGIACIDLDKCIDSEGNRNGVATLISNELKDTYCEKSASGNGLHFFVKDDILAGDKYRNRIETEQGEIEVYQSGRFISMTGDIVGNATSLSKCPAATISSLRKTLGERKPESATERKSSATIDFSNQSDEQVLERIRRSRKGSAFDNLYNGGSITGDKSRDDLAMLNTLAFFTDCNEAQMRRIFECSARFRPTEKGGAYLDRTIKKACESLTVRFGEHKGETGKRRTK